MKRVHHIVTEARKRHQPGATYRELRVVAQDVVVLYVQEKAMEEPVKEAKALIEAIDKELGGPRKP